jgi:ElaB/YqjD/DUF883 family membrane-anchored ribosome-binding protein
MENTIETGKTAVRRAARNGGAAGRDEWHKLVADVEDLVKKVANVDDADIAAIRSRVQDTLARAKASAGAGYAAVRDSAEMVRERAGEATDATDEYVHENPWAAVGIAAAVGIIIGFVAGRR